MATGVTRYSSADASHPVLTGSAGSLVAVLHAILVAGYGAKPAAGWASAFTGTNQEAYRMATVGGTGFYLQVDDNNPNATSLGREARFRGWEAMTSVTAGTNSFPQGTQGSGGFLWVRKSPTNDATEIQWKAFADKYTLYFFPNTPDFTGYGGYMAGDIFSLKTPDPYRAMTIGRIVPNSSADSDDNMQTLFAPAIASGLVAGHYMPRNTKGDIATSIQVGKHAGDGVKSTNLLLATADRMGNGMVQYPNPYDGSLLLSKVWVHEGSKQLIVRGRLRGIWDFLHPPASPVNDGDTFSGTGDLAGKTFEVVKPIADGDGLYVMETSDTWETST